MEEKTKIQTSETFVIGALLAWVGGFLDAYSYLLRGHVFANAQTGNIVLLGICIQKSQWQNAVYYLIPIGAFAAGVFLVEWVKMKHKAKQMQGTIHWRQKILLAEMILLIIVGCIPCGNYNIYANILISFLCAMQVESFRRVHGQPFASTMCTGNLRSGTEALYSYCLTHDKNYRRKVCRYFGIILCFVFGAVIGSLLSNTMGQYEIFVCCGILGVAAALMFIEEFN